MRVLLLERVAGVGDVGAAGDRRSALLQRIEAQQQRLAHPVNVGRAPVGRDRGGVVGGACGGDGGGGVVVLATVVGASGQQEVKVVGLQDDWMGRRMKV